VRARVAVLTALAAVVGIGAVVAVPVVKRALYPHPAQAQVPSATSAPVGRAQIAMQPQPSTAPSPAAVTVPNYLNFFGWTLLDRGSGQVSGSANRETARSTTESMIKVWTASDFLRHQAQAGRQPSKAALDELTGMIVNSDDNAGHKYYELNGGDASITELVSTCGLRNTNRPSPADEWSYTTMSPADAVRMGTCIANGTAAGPKWTNWVLSTMRNVRGGVADQQRSTGGGRWGVIDGLPAATAAGTSIKNGWTAQTYDHNWHVNCLAINSGWVLAIEMRYPWTSPDGDWRHASNLQQGADVCKSVAGQLITA
jgi:hypothetical protein